MKEWEAFTNPEQWKEYIQELIKTNDKAFCRGVVLIYRLQTAEEQSIKETTIQNGVGFAGVDAKFMSDIAEMILQGKQLSARQEAIARNKLKKYWKQLMRISKKEILI